VSCAEPDGRSAPVFELEGSSVVYDGHAALADANLRVERGEAVALVGPSGAGKTTLLRLLCAAVTPTSGRVLAASQDLAALPQRKLQALRARIGFVHQDLALVPNLRVSQNVIAGSLGSLGFLRSVRAMLAPSSRELDRAAAILERVGIGEKLFQRTDSLSGGQRQRVAIARALLAEPRILILDDATSSVDARTEAQIKVGLREAMEGRTTFIVAHRLSTISLADEIVVLDHGRIVDRGTHEELLERCPLYEEIAEKGLEDSVYLQRDLEEREELAKL
jgi:ATP-binding cassette subfamily B protein